MAAGYANARPPVHPRVLALLRRDVLAEWALDVGCGSGLSTRALQGVARRCVGIEPTVAMLKWANAVAPEAHFVAGSAETIPLRSRSVDLITAAGSLNYVDLERFFPEAARILTAEGELVVYDFSPGRRFTDAGGLDEWFSEFHRRYPPPAHEARPLSPEILASLDSGFRVRRHEYFEIPLTLTPEFYLNYMLTETNVAAAVRSGIPLEEIRSWCAETLAPVWQGRARDVVFSGYFACMVRD